RAYPQNRPRAAAAAPRAPAEEEESVIAIPLEHPALGSPREEGTAPGEYPLLTLPEQRQKRHSASTRASLQVERSGSPTGTNRISLPRSVSIDIARSKSGESSPLSPLSPGFKLDKGKGKAVEEEDQIAPGTYQQNTYQEQETITGLEGQNISQLPTKPVPGISFDRKTTMSNDLEPGPPPQNTYNPGGTSHLPPNASLTSLPEGLGPALSSNNTSIIGSDGPAANPAEEWGPAHPCFPHPNPHVPVTSPLYHTTRIIRIRRDWMLEGDLAPTFSNLYPEILDPAGVSEQDFRALIDRINRELIPAFNPRSWRNVLDGVLSLLTGWAWEDMGCSAVKTRLARLERYLDDWNREMESRCKEGGPGSAPRVLDIQVPDPEISYPAPVSEIGDVVVEGEASAG
ncbi:hypothetical protein M430DRAFT_98512, partial [Amorphotheca resinae ATCC 22711]